MKSTLLLFCIASFALSSYAQDIPNPSFENWSEKGTAPFIYSDPDGWSTSNVFSPFGYPILVEKVADAQHGSWALKATTKTTTSFFNSGKDTLSCYVTLSFPHKGVPAYFNGYYKSDVKGIDSAAIYVTVPWKENYSTIIAYQIIRGNSNGQYVPFSLPTYYFGETKDSITVIISTNFSFNSNKKGTPGTTLTVDNLSFSDFPLAVEDQQTSNTIFPLSPNPSSGYFHIASPIGTGEISICNTAGKVVYKEQYNTLEAKDIDLSNQPKGLYFIVFKAGSKMYNEKLLLF